MNKYFFPCPDFESNNSLKKLCLQVLCVLAMFMVCFSQENNDFYDNTPEKALAGALKIEVAGEVANPGFVDLGGLPRRSLIVREARLEKGAIAFIGSYRYDGYSLFDILKEKVVAKKNQAEFRSIIDLLVAVENAKGEKVILSWGEIYYPSALHRVIIADRVAPIIPSETKENWPLPEAAKLVCGDDLVSERNLGAPTRITVFSAPLSLPGKKGQKPLYAANFQVTPAGGQTVAFDPAWFGQLRVYPAVFYGRGKGFHGIEQFIGCPLKDALKNFFTFDSATLQRGYMVVGSVDGYRVALTCSELFNRNDQAEFLLIDRGQGQDGGRYALFPAPDFFSDRAVKAVGAIHFLTY
ncbi:MAG: hypothetical protein NTW95_00870 [Candidatus Aminicenantes bacterium]|nr:hypothetical protein [Candidatus Aminicenantes bacterium]